MLYSLSIRTGLINPNSRKEERSFFICSGEWVRALFILNKAGVKVAITTDHPVTVIQCLPLCAGIAAKEGLGIEEGLKAITINAAEICNVSSRVGSLEVGKDADITIYDGNPMEIFSNCLYTIIDGKIVYQAD